MRVKTANRVGEVYGRLTITARAGETSRRQTLWRCRCECGTEKTIELTAMRSGRTVSCGCFAKEVLSQRLLRHGGAKRGYRLREYSVWRSIKQRCTNPKVPEYRHYGGRGIQLCERWSASFEDFMTDMGPKPSPAHEIDRIDNDRGYEPGNCRWTTRREQMRNTRGCRAVIRSDGEKYSTIVEAAEELGASVHGISAVCRGRQKTASGYGWAYGALDEVGTLADAHSKPASRQLTDEDQP